MMNKILPCMLMLFTQSVLAWGPDGHRIVAQIAENNLSQTAKTKIQALLPGATLASVSNWADVVKGKPEWKHTATWHYVDIPDGQTYETTEHAPDGDAVSAITDLVKVLKSKNATPMDRQSALKFLIHFVGDIHQPLHVGRPEDRGGNDIRLIYNGRALNLHSLWDSAIINKQNMDYQKYARFLQTEFKPLTFAAEGFPFKQVISENVSFRPQIYDFSGIVEPIVLSDAYLTRNIKMLNGQLLKGGQRLTALLNEIFR